MPVTARSPAAFEAWIEGGKPQPESRNRLLRPPPQPPFYMRLVCQMSPNVSSDANVQAIVAKLLLCWRLYAVRRAAEDCMTNSTVTAQKQMAELDWRRIGAD